MRSEACPSRRRPLLPINGRTLRVAATFESSRRNPRALLFLYPFLWHFKGVCFAYRLLFARDTISHVRARLRVPFIFPLRDLLISRSRGLVPHTQQSTPRGYSREPTFVRFQRLYPGSSSFVPDGIRSFHFAALLPPSSTLTMFLYMVETQCEDL